MKLLLSKIPAVAAMLLTLYSYFYYVQYLLGSTNPDVWLVSVIIAMFSVPFYLIDAIISFIRALKKDDAKFNYLLSLILVGSIPMVVVFGGDGRDLINAIWNIYYLLMFVLEIISIKKAYEAMKAKKQNA